MEFELYPSSALHEMYKIITTNARRLTKSNLKNQQPCGWHFGPEAFAMQFNYVNAVMNIYDFNDIPVMWLNSLSYVIIWKKSIFNIIGFRDWFKKEIKWWRENVLLSHRAINVIAIDKKINVIIILKDLPAKLVF